eukprot:113909_1
MMKSRHFYRRFQSAIQLRNISSHRSRYGYPVMGALGGALLYGWGSVALAESQTQSKKDHAEDPEVGWREYFTGTYENRIRDLSTPEKVFSTFASVSKEGDSPWVKYMTITDFARSMLPFDFLGDSAIPVSNDSAHADKELPKIFDLVDINKDGLISQAEYVLFSTLLSIPEHHIEISFRMFDLDGNGSIDREEFVNMMDVMRPNSLTAFSFAAATEGAVNFQIWFGQEGDQSLSFLRFRDFIRDLRSLMLELDFSRFDSDDTGYISAKGFGMSLIGYCNRSSLPTYVKRLRSMELEGRVSEREFMEFSHAISHVGDISRALHLYSDSKHLISKADFQRAVWAVNGVLLQPLLVDIIFYIFDANGDGNLDQDELIGALKHRYENNSFHEKDVGLMRVSSCVMKCMSREK